MAGGLVVPDELSAGAPDPKIKASGRLAAEYICPMDPEVSQDHPGACPKCGMALERAAGSAPATRVEYTCPMHPEIVRDGAGSCPICGMALEPRTVVAEHEENPDSVDLYFLGLQVFGKGGVDNIRRARELFERAVALDPGNVDALVGAARAGVILGAIYGFDDRASTLAEAETLLIKGISLAPRNFWAHLWLGFVFIHTNRAQRGIGELEQAAALNRNLGAAHAWIGLAKIVMGRAEEAEAHINEAFRLAPAESFGFMWWHLLGVAKLHLGADEEAVALFRRSIDTNRNYPLSQFYSAAALALVGRLDEARAEAKSALALAPNYSLARFRKAAEGDNPVFLRQRERIAEGLRKAGIPEE